MIIDCSKYGGECACGKPHNIMTKKIVVESGCLKDFRKWLEECGISGPVAVIYDTNTYNNKWIPHERSVSVLWRRAAQLLNKPYLTHGG